MRKFKNNARNILRREFGIQQNLFEIFQSSGHTVFIEDVCTRLIDKSHLFINPLIPKSKSDWKQTLKTLALHGFNNQKVCNTFFFLVEYSASCIKNTIF